MRRVNKRLLANKRQLVSELKLAYRRLHEAEANLAYYDHHCHCLAQRRPAVLLWDSFRRALEAKRAAEAEARTSVPPSGPEWDEACNELSRKTGAKEVA